jgi:hypothetical protein
MNEVQKYQNIHPIRGEYFQSLLKEAAEAGILETARIRNIQVELLNLLSKQINRFTFGDSSSVKAEDAQNLLQSICFTIGSILKEKGDTDQALELLETEGLEVLFNKGNELIKSYFSKAKELWNKIKSESLQISNLAYNDTIFTGIKEFFDSYDCRFGAHETNGSIDYPLSNDEMDLTGIEYIYEYLYHLDMENAFCRRFAPESIEYLMRGCSKHYREDLLNVYEPVLTNLLGRSILNYDLCELYIDEGDRALLEARFSGLTDKELEEVLKNAFFSVMSYFEISDCNALDYLKKAVYDISRRISNSMALNRLDRIFVTLKKENEKPAYEFVDGKQMEDEGLRKLIDEIRACRHLSDKIAMVSRSVKSLSDLTEVLKECFFDTEYEKVFLLLDKADISQLKRFIEQNQDDTEPEYDWQKALLRFIEKTEYEKMFGCWLQFACYFI